MEKYLVDNSNSKKWLDLIPVITGLFLLLLGEPVLTSSLLAIIAISFLAVRYYALSKRLVFILLFAFFIRLFFIFFDELFHIYPYSADSPKYNLVAIQIIENFHHHIPIYHGISESTAVKSYSLFIGIIYYFLGEYQVFVRLINALLGVVSVALVYKISIKIFNDKKIAHWASIGTACYPSLILFSCVNMRDSLILFLSLEMIYYFFKAKAMNFISFQTIIFIVFFILNGWLRPQNLILFALIFIVYVYYKIFSGIYSKRLKLFYLFSLLVGLIMFVNIYHERIIFYIIEYPLQQMAGRAVGGSAYLVGLKYVNFFDIIKYMPIRFIYFSFGPFIWNVRSPFMLLSFFESVFILALFYCSIKYFLFRFGELNRDFQVFLLLFGLMGLLANSIVDSNFGTAIRHRMVYIIPFMIFTSAYLSNFKFYFLKSK